MPPHEVSALSGVTRRELLQVGLAAVALDAAGELVVPDPAFGRTAGPYLPYGRNSYFRSRVEGAPVARRATRRFRRFMRHHPDQRGTRHPVINGLRGNRWGTVYAEGRSADPVWRLTGDVPRQGRRLRTRGFHAPRWLGAQLSGTSDSPFVVMDRASGISVWGADARVVARRTIRVGAAGLFVHRSNGLDQRNPRSNSRVNFRSRGAIPDAMVIRRDRMEYALRHGTDLGYVLHMFFVETRSRAGSCHPMVGFEEGKSGWGAQGRHLAISPRVNLARRGLSPAGLVIARTLQRHGCYLGDNSGSRTALKVEQASRRHNPWAGLGLHHHSLAGITWDDFVVLRKGW